MTNIAPHAHEVTGTAQILFGLSGYYLVHILKKHVVFKLKLTVLYTLIIIGGALSFFLNLCMYRSILNVLCLGMVMMLYFRSMKYYISPVLYGNLQLAKRLELLPDMIWIKDAGNRFIYANKAIREQLLLMPAASDVTGKTSGDIANIQRSRGIKYTFGKVCCNSDEVVKENKKPMRFLETGMVGRRFFALQVYKTPLTKIINNKEITIGTIGSARDLTYDYNDHKDLIKIVMDTFEDAPNKTHLLELLNRHSNRFAFK